MRLLLVEDDPSTAKALELNLAADGFKIHTTDFGDEAIDLAKNYEYDLILLEDQLEEMEGIQVLRSIRMAGVTTPVIFLADRATTERKIETFKSGADDFLVKPVHRDELTARIQAVARRSKGHATSTIKVGSLVLDIDAKIVDYVGRRIHLTNKEFQLLELLCMRKNQTVPREAMLNHLYGGMDEPELKIIDVFVCKIRGKLKNVNGIDPIETVWGRGYKIVEPAAPAIAA